MVKTHKCTLHKYHYPPVTDTDIHHIVPKQYKGPSIESNLVEVCNNCHRSMHEYMDAILGLAAPPKITRAQKRYAELGLKGLWYGVQ